MSNVSTRQPKKATPVAKAVTAVTTPATPVTDLAPSGQPPALPEEWRTAATESRNVVMSLVQEVMTNEASRVVHNCGRADRLLGFVVDGFGRVQNDAEKDDFESHAFDAEALLAGAMKLLEAENGNALDQLKLRHAFQILDKLTDALMGDEIYPVWDAIRYAPKPTAPTHDPLNGFAPQQVRTVLTEIATKADTLGTFLRQTRDRTYDENSSDLYATIDMAAMMADTLGLLADTPTEGIVRGDAMVWIIGPAFADDGKAVTA